MSERMTAINLPGRFGSGWAEWGRKTVPEMIAAIRDRAELMKRDAEAILAAKDSDFYVCTYRGVHVRRDLEVLQDSRASRENTHTVQRMRMEKSSEKVA
jgi:hypothetical protein